MASESPQVKVIIDPLRVKRIKAIDEHGLEETLEEPSREQRLLQALAKIPFGPPPKDDAQTFQKRKKLKGKQKEEKVDDVSSQDEATLSLDEDASAAQGPSTVRNWRDVLESLAQAREELRVISDVIGHVEANQWLSIVNISRPKLQGAEAEADLLGRMARKQVDLKMVSLNLESSSKAMRSVSAAQSPFFGALMRLQKAWKVKRGKMGLRGIQALGPGDTGTTQSGSSSAQLYLADVALPFTAGTSSTHASQVQGQGEGGTTVSSLLLKRAVNGQLVVGAGLGRGGSGIWEVKVTLPRHGKREERGKGKVELSGSGLPEGNGKEKGGEGEAGEVQRAARAAHAVLKSAQISWFQHQVYRAVELEAVSQQGPLAAPICNFDSSSLSLDCGPQGGVLTLSLSHPQQEIPETPHRNAPASDRGQDQSEDADLSTPCTLFLKQCYLRSFAEELKHGPYTEPPPVPTPLSGVAGLGSSRSRGAPPQSCWGLLCRKTSLTQTRTEDLS